MSFCPCGKEAADGSPLCDRCSALQVLELTPSATPSDVRAAYHMLVKVWHPDRFQSDAGLKQAANEKLKAINSAYLFLTSNGAKGARPRRKPAAQSEPPSQPRNSQYDSGPDRRRDPRPAAAATSRGFTGLFSLRNCLAMFTAAGALQRVALLLLGLTAGAVSLKVMDTTLSSDPDCARVYLPYRAAIGEQLNGTRKRVFDDVASIFRRFRHQPELPAAPPESSAAAAQASQTAGASRPAKKRVALTKFQPIITLGLSKDEVIAIAGTPTSSDDNKLVFGNSEVYLKNGSVAGWKIDPASPLHVKLWPTTEVDRTLQVFSVDSTKDDVLVVQGTPTLLSQDTFGYGSSEVYFRNNRVTSWKNDPMSVPLRAVSR
jgi:hypothetical protein